MNPRQYISILIIIFPLFVFSQNIDSLEKILPTLKGRERVDVLNKIVKIKQTEECEKDAKEAYSLAKKLGYKKGLISAAVGLGFTYLHKNNYTKSRKFFLEAVSLCGNTYDNKKIYAYLGLGQIGVDQNDLIAAIDYGLIALKMAEENAEIQSIIDAHFLLSQIYDSFENWEESENQLNIVLDMVDSLDNEQLSALYLDFGVNMYNQSKYPEALSFLYKGKKLVEKLTDKHYQEYLSSYMYGNLANVYNSVDKPDSAIYYGNKSIELDSLAEDSSYLAVDYYSLSKAYSLKKDYAKASFYAKKSLAIGKNESLHANKVNTYKILKKIAIDKKEYLDALKYDELADIYTDSTTNVANAMKLMEQKAQFYLKEKESKIKVLEEKSEFEKSIIKISIFAIILLLLVSLLLLNRIKLRKKVYEANLQLIESQKKQKELEINAITEKNKAQQKFLEEKIELKNRALASNAIFIASKNQLLSDIQHFIEKTIPQTTGELNKTLKSGLRKIKQRAHVEEDWQYFNDHFKRIHPKFYANIHQKYPELTETDYRLCAYIHLKLSNKEIAQLQNITTESVTKARYRLKKKMNIASSLTETIRNM